MVTTNTKQEFKPKMFIVRGGDENLLGVLQRLMIHFSMLLNTDKNEQKIEHDNQPK